MNSTESIADAFDIMEIQTPVQILSDQAYAYRALIVATLCIASIAICLSLILMVSMTLPLLSKSRRKQYSTYNLYLAYLSVPDFVVYTYVVHLILTRHDSNFFPLMDDDGTIQWMFEDNRFDHNVYAMYVAANLYTNAFLINECYLLLRDSANVRRHAPPSIRRVTNHAIIAYSMGIFAFVLEVIVSELNLEDNKKWFVVYEVICYLIFVIVPLSVLGILWFKIHQEGLVKSTISMYQGRLKVLVTYFTRIVVTYLVCSGIGTVSYMVYWSTLQEINVAKVLCYVAFLFFSGLQATANFILSLTKPDARQFVVNLFVGDYCKKAPKPSKDEKTEVEDDTELESDAEVYDAFLGQDEDLEHTVRNVSIMPQPTQSNRASLFCRFSTFVSSGSMRLPEDKNWMDMKDDDDDEEDSSALFEVVGSSPSTRISTRIEPILESKETA